MTSPLLQGEPRPVEGLVPFAATTVDVTASPQDGPSLLLRAAARLTAAAPLGDQPALARGELTCRLEPGLQARMFLTTEMRPGAAADRLLRLNLTLSGSSAPSAAVLARWAEIWHRQPLSALEVERVAGELPLMNATVERLRPGKPLAGYALLVTGHFLTDLVHLVGCLGELGAPLEAVTVLRKDYAYQWRDRVHGHLQEWGVTVADCTDSRAVHEHAVRADRAGLRPLALDDGGYVAPQLLDAARAGTWAGDWAGVVEQTMSGVYKLRGREPELTFPVFSVAQSRLKGRIESYWIADQAVTTALSLLPAPKIEGQPALVIGYGNVGAQIADILARRRMRVAVHDADILHLIEAHERGYTTARSLPDLLGDHAPLLVFGATGRTSMSSPEFTALRRPAYLASVSSRDVEFDLAALEALSGRRPASPGTAGHRPSSTYGLPSGVDVTVLAGGRPVNFYETDSISNLHSDLVYAGMLTGACAVTAPATTPGLDPAWADEVLEESGLLQDYYHRYGPPAGRPIPASTNPEFAPTSPVHRGFADLTAGGEDTRHN
ncbi:hypothetical protein OHB07_28640 [Streptomyces sp. NBC_00111]|uniref:hypothetical protein n=1 Tax=Streptomyces sp. NBC_00111 TaxID=2975655 RepID=UPI00324FF04C